MPVPPDRFRVFKFDDSSAGPAHRLGGALTRIDHELQRSPLAVVVSAMGDTDAWLLDAVAAAAQGRFDEADAIVDRVAQLAVDSARHALGAPAAELQGVQLAVTFLVMPLRKVLLGISLLREQTPQATDLVLSFGARVSASVMTAILRGRGVEAAFVDARSWAITDAAFGDAAIDWPATEALLHARRDDWRDVVTVHAGSIGQTVDGRTTTLGRNGADTTATLLARGLDASAVVFCSDAPAIMTADPAIVADARAVRHLSTLEALELAHLGAPGLHARTLQPLLASGLPLFLRPTADPDAAGTRIDATGSAEPSGPTCIAAWHKLALLQVRPSAFARSTPLALHVLAALDADGVQPVAASLAAHGQGISVVVAAGSAPTAIAALEAALAGPLAEGLIAPISLRAPVTLVALVAEHLSERPELTGRLHTTLAHLGVPVLTSLQGASTRSSSVVIDGHAAPQAIRALHAAFDLGLDVELIPDTRDLRGD